MRSLELRRCVAAIAFALVMAKSFVGLCADEKTSRREYTFEVRIYQALTNVTGAGLTSQTLPGMNGWFQVIHQKLDDVELVMDGETLTWNGQKSPDNPRIIGLAAPTIITLEGKPAVIFTGSEESLQYMTRNQDGLFELKTNDADRAGVSGAAKSTGGSGQHPALLDTDEVGVFISVKPNGVSGDRVLDCDLSFRYSWVKARERIEGVNLDVGRPIFGRVATEGSVQMRLGEWSCYQTPVESEGHIYLFVRAQEKVNDARQIQNTGAAETAPAASGPKIEVGGTVEVRAGIRK